MSKSIGSIKVELDLSRVVEQLKGAAAAMQKFAAEIEQMTESAFECASATAEKEASAPFPCEECVHAWVSGGAARSCCIGDKWEACKYVRGSERCRENAKREEQ